MEPLARFRHDGVRKGRIEFRFNPQLDKHLTGQRDPGDFVPQGDHLHFGFERLAFFPRTTSSTLKACTASMNESASAVSEPR